MLAALLLCAVPLLLPLLPGRHYQRVLSIPQVLTQAAARLPFLADTVVAIWVNFGKGEAPALPSIWAWAGLLGVLLCFAAAFVRRVRLEAALIVFGLALVLASSLRLLMWPVPYRALHGLFPPAPALAVSAYALADAWRRRAYALRTLAAATAAYLLIGTLVVFAFYVDPQGHYLPALEWGPRFLLTLYPLMTVLALVMLQSYWRSERPAWLRRLVVGLVVLGLCVGVQFEGRGLLMLHQTRTRLALWESALPSVEPVLTDIWWLPSAAAPFFVSHEVYYARGAERVREWIDLAARHGVDSFVFAGLALPDAAALGRVELVEQRNVDGLQLVRFRVRTESAIGGGQ